MQARSAEQRHEGEPLDAARPHSGAIGVVSGASGVVWLTVAYLVWRATTLGWGAILLLSVPLFAVEIWGLLQLNALRYQAVHRRTASPPTSRHGHEPVDVVITTAGRSPEDLERTLIACRSLPGDRAVRVVDRWLLPEIAPLAARHGAEYATVGVDPMDDPSVVVSGDDEHPVLWLEAGQVPMPDVDEATIWFDDPTVAVVQIGVGLLNTDSLAHVDRGRDEHALDRTVLGPALATRGRAPWSGAAAILRPEPLRAAARGVGVGSPRSVEQTLIRLHADGLRTAFDARPLVRDAAPDSLAEYLDDRRTRVRRTLGVLRTAESPLTGSAIPLAVRWTHLAMWSRFADGLRLAMLAAITAAVLLTGVMPTTAPLHVLVPLWVITAVGAARSRHRLAAGTMAYGDWLRNGWRTLGVDLAAIGDVITGRRRTRAIDDDRAQGWASLGRLRLLTTAVVALELAVVARGATLIWGDALPPFPTGARMVVLVFALGALVPMIDVLQLVVKRHQRRKTTRIRTVVPATVDGVTTSTLDLAANGIGFTLHDPPDLGATLAVRLELPRLDGGTSIVSAEAVVRSATLLETGGHRVGVEIGRMSERSRVDLISFCAVDHPYMERLDTPQPPKLAPADFAVEGATLHRLPVRVLTFAAVGLGLTTAIAGPVASAAEVRVPTVCVTDAAGEPAVGASLRMTRPNGEAIQTGPIGEDGCVRLQRAVDRVTIEVTLDGMTRTVTRSLGARTLVRFETGTLGVEARSSDGTPLSDVAVRYWADGWRDASRDGESVVVELLEGETDVEFRRDGRRFITSATVDGDTDVVVRLARLVPDAGAEIADVDLGDGWRRFEDGMEVLPGRLAVREADGTVTKLVIVGGTQTSLPSGRPS